MVRKPSGPSAKSPAAASSSGCAQGWHAVKREPMINAPAVWRGVAVGARGLEHSLGDEGDAQSGNRRVQPKDDSGFCGLVYDGPTNPTCASERTTHGARGLPLEVVDGRLELPGRRLRSSAGPPPGALLATGVRDAPLDASSRLGSPSIRFGAHRRASTHAGGHAGMQACRHAGMQACRHAGVKDNQHRAYLPTYRYAKTKRSYTKHILQIRVSHGVIWYEMA